ncbi:ribonuclease domain-containing protein [Lapillicoccus sp.]|uniref:ribonuclease domain-containing protein n=1 Tax=Lapillicoccus sp. TaxID=1909287 RepID=UPI00398309FA
MALLVGGLVLLVAVGLSLTRSTSGPATSAGARTSAADPATGLRWVDESTLNEQARQTLTAIRAGGPFPYPRNDGVTFDNRERILPAKGKGYYKEYTVTTPGSPDRGPRRIITGQDGARFYTGDHYASFERIREGA